MVPVPCFCCPKNYIIYTAPIASVIHIQITTPQPFIHYVGKRDSSRYWLLYILPSLFLLYCYIKIILRFFFLQIMESSLTILDKTIFELNFNTTSNKCNYLGGGRYEFNLEYLEYFPKNAKKLGIKNIQVPVLEKDLTFKLFCGLKLETFTQQKLTSYSVKYTNYVFLSNFLDTVLNNTVHDRPNICLRFDTPHDKHFCALDGALQRHPNFNIRYKDSRFMLSMRPDLQVIICRDLAAVLGFLKPDNMLSKAEIDGGFVILNETRMLSLTDLYFKNSFEKSLFVVLYDYIVDYTILGNGETLPILYSAEVGNFGYVGKPDMLLTVKKLTGTRKLGRFNFGFLDCDMKPFMRHLDFKKKPILFTLIFFS